MDDIISKILEMDETARKLNDEVMAEKIASREEVVRKRQEVYDKYLSSAKEHIREFKNAAQKASDEEWQETEKYYKEVSLALERKFKENKQQWVDEIYNDVISN